MPSRVSSSRHGVWCTGSPAPLWALMALWVAGTEAQQVAEHLVATTGSPHSHFTVAAEPCDPRSLDRVTRPPQWAIGVQETAAIIALSLAKLGPRADTPRAGNLAKGALAGHAALSDSNDDAPRAGVLAVALALPKLKIAVVMFRGTNQSVEQQNSNSSVAQQYWRALGAAWNRSSGASNDGSPQGGEWGAAFLDCGPLAGRWLQSYSVAVGFKQYKAVAAVFIAADLDQCDIYLGEIFGGTHRCDPETTNCIPEPGWGSHRGRYHCECRKGYFMPGSPPTWGGFSGDVVETDPIGEHRCIACPPRCERCDSSGECDARGDPLLRASLLAVQACCMFVVLVLAVVVFRQRKCKTIASGMWTILETILLGIFLLYSAVLVRFFPASAERCLVEPWCRELGFVVCYGAIILKLYRHLIEFRTRKAHRWVVRDVDLLKYLAAMVVAVLCYLAAFSASSLDYLEHHSLIGTGITTTGLRFTACKPLRWDYVTQAGEMLILVFGIHLSYASRNASTQFQERQFLCATICVEAVVSGCFYVMRALYVNVTHPDHAFLAFFIRSQLTCTTALLLIFIPKLWYQHKQVRSLAQEYSCRLPVDAFKAGAGEPGGPSQGEPDVAELNLADMNPEDIRAELKRLYTQLEVLKNKTIRNDNPHISKRRGGRKVPHRRFSLQKKGSRDKIKQQRSQRPIAEQEVTEADASRTPEDSVCSVEGPSGAVSDLYGTSTGPSDCK